MDDSVEYLAPRVAVGVCLLGLICIYVIYYRLFNVTRPRVVCKDADRLQGLRRHCPALFEHYWPTFWAPQGHVQSIVRLLMQQAPSVESLGGRRETIKMSDGGHVCLDWFESCEEDGGGNQGGPIVLILCGMTGSSKETYTRHWVDDCRRLGYRCVVFNYRGCGNSKLSTPKLFSLGDVDDLTEVADYLHFHNPSSTIVAVGVSMGSVQLIRYVAECRRKARPCRISAGLVFSVIWSLRESDKALHTNLFNKHVISRFLTRRYRNLIKENRQVFEDFQARNELCCDYEKALRVRTDSVCIDPKQRHLLVLYILHFC
ncbi:Phospholipase ABHD3 [Geodia barretti]|uniref:Phospholipase ABHD3 n=1 Tax=Geodia barretti TaxID=519541 RepID=A0AA35U1R4_GEOBA|nr:Phospholipase ABHD3 [Geodia barretti]